MAKRAAWPVPALIAVALVLGGPASAQQTGGQAGRTTAPGAAAPLSPPPPSRKPDPDANVPCDPANSNPPCRPTGPAGSEGAGSGLVLPPELFDLLAGLAAGRSPEGSPGRTTGPGARPPVVAGGGPSPAPASPSGPPSTPPPAPPVPLPSAGPVAAPPEPTPPPAPVPAPPRVPPRAVAGSAVPDEVLVTLDGDQALAEAIAAANNLEIRALRTSDLLGSTLVRYGIPDGRGIGLVLAQVDADGRAEAAEPNHIFSLQQGSAFPQYAFERISLPAAEADGAGIPVAVIDSGVDAAHPALAGVLAASHDALPDQPVADREHGTAVVGLIAAAGAVRGTAPGARVHHSRAFEGGRSTMEAILASLDWAAGQGVRIVNMSFAGPRNRLMQRACGTARSRGIVLVAAAGNAGPGAPFAFPAAFDSVIAVTATDDRDRLMPEANRGRYVFVAAPGVDVVAPVPGGTDFLTGTSMASAVLAGAVANLLREDGSRGPDWVERALAASAVDLGPPGRDPDFGHGRFDFRTARAVAPL